MKYVLVLCVHMYIHIYKCLYRHTHIHRQRSPVTNVKSTLRAFEQGLIGGASVREPEFVLVPLQAVNGASGGGLAGSHVGPVGTHRWSAVQTTFCALRCHCWMKKEQLLNRLLQ